MGYAIITFIDGMIDGIMVALFSRALQHLNATLAPRYLCRLNRILVLFIRPPGPYYLLFFAFFVRFYYEYQVVKFIVF